MKKVFLIPVLAFALFAVSCAGNSSETKGETLVVVEAEDDNHHAEPSEVALNDGEKWQANSETTEGVNKMLTLVGDAEKSESPDYLALKDNMQHEFNVVLEKCTMKGESHDQLHNYLLPLKAKFDQLDENSTKNDVEELNHYLASYSNFFN